MVRHRKNYPSTVTASDIAQMKSALQAFHDLWSTRFARFMASSGSTIKYHKFTTHVFEAITRLGSLKHYSAQFYESANRVDKILYQGTTRRNTNNVFQREMVRRGRIIDAMEQVSTFNQDDLVKERDTAYKRAHQSGQHEFPATYQRLAFGEPNGPAREAWEQAVEAQDDLKKLPAKLASFLQKRVDDLPPAIHSVKTAVLAATVPWLPQDEAELQTVRATPNFFGKPVFDCVRVQVQPERRGDPDAEFATLRHLFTLPGDPERKLALIRWFNRTGREDILTQAGCVSLCLGPYDVIDLDSVSRREYVMPDFKSEDDNIKGQFHTCVWKWSRVPIQGYSRS